MSRSRGLENRTNHSTTFTIELPCACAKIMAYKQNVKKKNSSIIVLVTRLISVNLTARFIFPEELNWQSLNTTINRSCCYFVLNLFLLSGFPTAVPLNCIVLEYGF